MVDSAPVARWPRLRSAARWTRPRHAYTRSFALVLAVGFPLVGCRANGRDPLRTYSTDVHVDGVDVVRQAADGAVELVDVEITYAGCPGQPREAVRGHAAFGECVKSHLSRESASVVIQGTDDRQHPWVVRSVAGCEVPVGPRDEPTFNDVRDCRPMSRNGVRIGFHCDMRASDELAAGCAWFLAR